MEFNGIFFGKMRSSMEFHGTREYGKGSMEFHGTWSVPISLTRAVPWNSMELGVRQFRWHEQFQTQHFKMKPFWFIFISILRYLYSIMVTACDPGHKLTHPTGITMCVNCNTRHAIDTPILSMHGDVCVLRPVTASITTSTHENVSWALFSVRLYSWHFCRLLHSLLAYL